MTGFGAIGNIIFFTCSSWFLLDSNKIKKQKVILILSSVWTINFIFLIVFKIGNWYTIDKKTIIKILFPNTFELNWYLTYYLLFYCIHPFLNKVINGLSKKEHLKIALILFILYFIVDFLLGSYFAFNNLVFFIVLYFIISYMKKYLKTIVEDKKVNMIILITSILLYLLLLLLTNFLGFRISILQNKMLYWVKNNNPFFVIIGITTFNLFYTNKFNNKLINLISSLLMLIYIIHENFFIINYIRPLIWLYIKNYFGYNNIIIEDLAFSALLFISSAIFAIVYKFFIEKLIIKLWTYNCDKIEKLFNNILGLLI